MNTRAVQIVKTLTPWAALSIGAAGLAMVIAAGTAYSVWATYRSRTDAAIAQAREQEYEAKFRTRIERYEKQIAGRSLFIAPGAPASEVVEKPSDVVESKPARPVRYAGPSVIAMINSRVWFSDGQRVGVGESGRGVKVLSIAPPWSARVEWEGAEFDVGLFARDEVVYKSGGGSPSGVNYVPASSSGILSPTIAKPAEAAAGGGNGATAGGVSASPSQGVAVGAPAPHPMPGGAVGAPPAAGASVPISGPENEEPEGHEAPGEGHEGTSGSSGNESSGGGSESPPPAPEEPEK